MNITELIFLLIIIILGVVVFGGVVLGLAVCDKLDTLTQVIREKQIILSIDKLEWDVKAQKGSTIYLPGD